jgi:hypothetical protein
VHDRRPARLPNYWTAEPLTDLPDDAVDGIARCSEELPAGPAQGFIVAWGGAVARVLEADSPLSARDATRSYERPAAVKATCDPENVFRASGNVAPSAG